MQPVNNLPIPLQYALWASWADDDARVALATSGGGSASAIDIYDTATGRMLRAIRPGPIDTVSTIELSPDGRQLLVAGSKRQLERVPPDELWLYRVDDDSPPTRLLGSVPYGVCRLGFSGDHRRVTIVSAVYPTERAAWSLVVVPADGSGSPLNFRASASEATRPPIAIELDANDEQTMFVYFSDRIERWSLPDFTRAVVRELPATIESVHARGAFLQLRATTDRGILDGRTWEPHWFRCSAIIHHSTVTEQGEWVGLSKLSVHSKGKVRCEIVRAGRADKRAKKQRIDERADEWWLGRAGRVAMFARYSRPTLGIVDLASGAVQALDRMAALQAPASQ